MMRYEGYRLNDIERRLSTARFRPLDVMVTGVTGAGKSTTLNSLFCKTVAKAGDSVNPETMALDSYSLNGLIRFWDTPGLGDGIEADKRHSKNIMDLLYKKYTMNGKAYGWIDLVLVIIEGINRDMGTTYRLLNDVIIPNISSDRILVAINQCDQSMKGRHWDNHHLVPDAVLVDFLEKQVLSIKRRVKEATGINIIEPVYYSAEYGFNVNELYDLIIDHIPTSRRDN